MGVVSAPEKRHSRSAMFHDNRRCSAREPRTEPADMTAHNTNSAGAALCRPCRGSYEEAVISAGSASASRTFHRRLSWNIALREYRLSGAIKCLFIVKHVWKYKIIDFSFPLPSHIYHHNVYMNYVFALELIAFVRFVHRDAMCNHH